ncbi:putative outer membrane receptor protein [unidentified eubacterium SCB49]|nr:putative outer membrane receptor protein [unidentified eubacterium SCB49]
MKNIISKISICLLTLGAIVSCEDNLEQVPYDAFGTENAFATAADFENAIRGVYSALTLDGHYGSGDGGSMLSAPDVLTDNVTLAQAGRGTKAYLHRYDYDGNATLTTMYSNNYSLIYRANQLLSFATGFEGDNKANVVAEAKALRALAHFNLVTFWGKIPTQSADANSSLGVAYVFEADPNIEPARNTVGEVYDFIVTDLTEAVANINETNDDGRMNRDAVNILLSRVYLYMGEWQKAANAAGAVTATVATRDNFTGIWADENQDGLVFFIPNATPILGNQIGVTWSQGPLTSIIPEYAVSSELFDLYSNNDIRKTAYIATATNSFGDYNAIIKLFGRAGQNNGEVDYKIFRASEAKLNRAEALYRLGQEGPALTALNAVRSQRYDTAPGSETGSALEAAIFLERRLEFAFEYQHFFDIKRRGLGIERPSTGEFADGSGTPSERLNLPAGSFLFQLPFPQTALDTNPNLVQNTGYSN